MTTFVHCRGCGQQIHESAPSCPKCGAPQGFQPRANAAPAQQTAAGQAAAEVPASWRRKFDLVEKAGGPRLPRARDLSFGERARLMFNVWGFLFGPFYYLAKGMWKKAITLFAVSAVLYFVLAVAVTALHGPEGILSLICPAMFATRANIDYFKKMVLSDNGWWCFRKSEISSASSTAAPDLQATVEEVDIQPQSYPPPSGAAGAENAVFATCRPESGASADGRGYARAGQTAALPTHPEPSPMAQKGSRRGSQR